MIAANLDAAWAQAHHIAQQWAGRGIPAFPIAISHDPHKYDGAGGLDKRPLTEHGHLDATTDPDTLTALFNDARRRARPGEEPGAGLCPGPAGYVQIDIDLKGGHNGFIAATNLGLQDTWGARTPSGGEHRMWRKPDPTKWVGNSSPWAGIDIRADAGWTVAPGTTTSWGTWSRNDIDDTQRWPDDVHTLPDTIWQRLDLHDTAPNVRHATAQHQRQLNDHLAATLHPDTLAAWEHLRDHHGAHSALWNVADGHTWLLATRPGKRGWGASAYIGSREHGQIWNMSSAWPGVPPETALYVADNQLVDQTTWHAHLLDQWAPEPDPADGELEPATAGTLDHYRINWHDLWHAPIGDDWLIEPLIAAHRAHALYAPAKTGKSLLIAWLAVMAALGRPTLDRPGGEPLTVLYCDLEMTPDDLRDRLENMGIGPQDNLDHLHWLSLPPLVLDTAEGARTLVQHARHINADLVIIDTTARAVTGDENSADTYRAFARWTGVGLKREGIAYLRTDHAGKDLDRGQRGSSAKNDDVDIVWQLTANDSQKITLKATHRRMGWVPEKLVLDKTDDPLGYRHTAQNLAWPEGTAEAAALMDAHQIPLGPSDRAVLAACKTAGIKGKAHVLRAAAKYRRTDPRRWDDTP